MQIYETQNYSYSCTINIKNNYRYLLDMFDNMKNSKIIKYSYWRCLYWGAKLDTFDETGKYDHSYDDAFEIDICTVILKNFVENTLFVDRNCIRIKDNYNFSNAEFYKPKYIAYLVLPDNITIDFHDMHYDSSEINSRTGWRNTVYHEINSINKPRIVKLDIPINEIDNTTDLSAIERLNFKKYNSYLEAKYYYEKLEKQMNAHFDFTNYVYCNDCLLPCCNNRLILICGNFEECVFTIESSKRENYYPVTIPVLDKNLINLVDLRKWTDILNIFFPDCLTDVIMCYLPPVLYVVNLNCAVLINIKLQREMDLRVSFYQ